MHQGDEVILFAVMGTLVREPFHAAVPAHFGIPLRRLVSEWDADNWVRFERGEIDERQCLAEFFRDRRRFDHRALADAVRSSYAWIDGMESVLAELARGGNRLHAFSNYPQWYRWIEERLQPSRFLSWSFVSCDTKVRKPDAEAYRFVEERLAVEPSRLLLIDDRPENCAAAVAAGWGAIRFTSAQELRVQLRGRALLSA